MTLRTCFTLAACAAGLALSTPAFAQESAYKNGSVWQFSNIKVMPGKFEAYMDYLSGNWRKIQEYGKKQGVIMSYHIWAVNNARKDEPDLILGIEYKDYMPNAQMEALQKKVEAMMAMDARKMDTASGDRAPLRTEFGGMELQELKLK